MVIPPGCTAYNQPLDVYFHQQVKIFIKEIQNCTHLLQDKRQLNTRNDAIKIHSLIANQMSSPAFQEMIQYAWFASKLTTERAVFRNVKQICFPKKPQASFCKCKRFIIFIKCSWCQESLCFPCFYDEYPPEKCNKFKIM